jgi:hypothetical protein
MYQKCLWSPFSGTHLVINHLHRTSPLCFAQGVQPLWIEGMVGFRNNGNNWLYMIFHQLPSFWSWLNLLYPLEEYSILPMSQVIQYQSRFPSSSSASLLKSQSIHFVRSLNRSSSPHKMSSNPNPTHPASLPNCLVETTLYAWVLFLHSCQPANQTPDVIQQTQCSNGGPKYDEPTQVAKPVWWFHRHMANSCYKRHTQSRGFVWKKMGIIFVILGFEI